MPRTSSGRSSSPSDHAIPRRQPDATATAAEPGAPRNVALSARVDGSRILTCEPPPAPAPTTRLGPGPQASVPAATAAPPVKPGAKASNDQRGVGVPYVKTLTTVGMPTPEPTIMLALPRAEAAATETPPRKEGAKGENESISARVPPSKSATCAGVPALEPTIKSALRSPLTSPAATDTPPWKERGKGERVAMGLWETVSYTFTSLVMPGPLPTISSARPSPVTSARATVTPPRNDRENGK